MRIEKKLVFGSCLVQTFIDMNTTSRKEAITFGLTHYFTGKPCVHNHVAKRSVLTRVCMECDRLRKEELRSTKADETRAKKRESYKKHAKKACAQKKTYRQANKGKINALNAARKTVIKQRTPVWLTAVDKERIGNEYKLAALLTKLTGEAWHVDHKVPLQGKLVSGLHVPYNLQVMRGKENISKKNKFEVDHA